MSHVFISYSKQDIVFARQLRKKLEAAHFAVWMDEQQLTPSDRWWREIEQNLQQCAAVVVIMSPASRESDWVERELLYAERLQKPVFPVWIAGDIWPRLANIQVNDMRQGIDAGLPPLLEGLKPVVPVSKRRRIRQRSQPRRISRTRRLLEHLAFTVLMMILGVVVVLVLDSVLYGDDDDVETRTVRNVTLVHVPEGCFTMGSEAGRPNERPPHEVCVDGFWIARTEITNNQYRKCVEDGACPPPEPSGEYEFDNPELAKHPVVNVTWHQAAAYAEWLGGVLPTEAQWEYAARGSDGRLYPWGDDEPNCERAVLTGCSDFAEPVGRHESGASWVGALDMGGNVWEWVADNYIRDGENYYEVVEPGILNPPGLPEGNERVLRGGSYLAEWCPGRATCREHFEPDFTNIDVGFRVVMFDPLPE
ncbi:MAG: SUMF1/EgtB/PvdO family nonheme iron enzyme [Anaerolineae bacterium]|nr:SUMF1/EgtB/PvdO family nonheme iron enzyme [Anaerolineae bacterium]